MTKGEDPYDDAVVRKLYHPNLRLLLVTEGPDGCRYYTKVKGPLYCLSILISMPLCTNLEMLHVFLFLLLKRTDLLSLTVNWFAQLRYFLLMCIN